MGTSCFDVAFGSDFERVVTGPAVGSAPFLPLASFLAGTTCSTGFPGRGWAELDCCFFLSKFFFGIINY